MDDTKEAVENLCASMERALKKRGPPELTGVGDRDAEEAIDLLRLLLAQRDAAETAKTALEAEKAKLLRGIERIADQRHKAIKALDAADRAGREREAALKKSLTALCEILESEEGGGVPGCIGSMNPAEHDVGVARALLTPAPIDDGTPR